MHVTVGELIGNFILIAGSFILLIVLVKKYAWSNLTSVFEERANKIAADLIKPFFIIPPSLLYHR